MEKPTTTVDAVQMVRRVRDAHHEELKGASRADRIAFYNNKARTGQPAADPARSSSGETASED